MTTAVPVLSSRIASATSLSGYVASITGLHLARLDRFVDHEEFVGLER
jgi:hypothetical protein